MEPIPNPGTKADVESLQLRVLVSLVGPVCKHRTARTTGLNIGQGRDSWELGWVLVQLPGGKRVRTEIAVLYRGGQYSDSTKA